MLSLLPSVPVPWGFQKGVKGRRKCMGLGLRASSLYSAITSFVTLGKSLSLSGLSFLTCQKPDSKGLV